MKKILILFLVCCFSFALPKHYEVKKAGIVKAFERSGNIWTGQPTKLLIEVINDSDYAYYHIVNPDPVFFNSIGKKVTFSGKVNVKIILDTVLFKIDTIETFSKTKTFFEKNIKVDTIYRNFLTIDDYNFKN